MFQTEIFTRKVVLEHPELPKISDSYRRNRHYNHSREPRKCLKKINQFMTELHQLTLVVTLLRYMGSDLISLVRRSMPNLIAYDICGVQPMTSLTGLIFAMRTTRFASMDAERALLLMRLCLISQTRTLLQMSVVEM